MRTGLFAAAILAVCTVSTVAQQRVPGPLGLERAVKIGTLRCMLTTPYDTWARCQYVGRVALPQCYQMDIKDNRLYCEKLPVAAF